VIQKSVYMGRQYDTIVIPIVKEDDARIVARSTSGKRAEIDWTWNNFIFTSQYTYFNIEPNKKVGAMTVHFLREEKARWHTVILSR
ncbi:hypothetical protein BO71DRAFT_336536, partial [Aspergillus ellipticus CBS 707.79]